MRMPSPVRDILYSNPPLVEAVLGFQFAPGPRPWDVAILQELQHRLEPDFPTTESVVGTDIVVNTQQPGAFSVSPSPEVRRFARSDGGMVVTVGPGVLGISSVHEKMPGGHPGWRVFRDMALAVLASYQEIATPGPVKQIGVRYINAIRFYPPEFQLGKFVDRLAGIIPSVLLNERNPFSFRLERLHDPEPQTVRKEIINVVAAGDPEGQGGKLVVDMDEILMIAENTELPYLAPVCDMLHAEVAKTFRILLNANTRRSFGISNPQPK